MKGKADRRCRKRHVLNVSLRCETDSFILLHQQECSLGIPGIERNLRLNAVFFQKLCRYVACILLRKMQYEFFAAEL